MPSAWLSVTLDDYEGHMGPAGVQQLDALSDLFAEALAYTQPESVAILGIAGGNGLDRIDPAITKRTVGFDVNPSYLDAVPKRYPNFRGLELHCCDLATEPVNAAPVALVHAAVIFEHAGLGQCLINACDLTVPGGALGVVLQLPGDFHAPIGDTPFPSIRSLQHDFALIDPRELTTLLNARAYHLELETRRALSGGKAFWMGLFRRS